MTVVSEHCRTSRLHVAATAKSPLTGGDVSENRIVNALLESLENAPGPKREPIEVGRLLAQCQRGVEQPPRPCPDWDRGCKRYDLEAWIGLMITPGRHCSRPAYSNAEGLAPSNCLYRSRSAMASKYPND